MSDSARRRLVDACADPRDRFLIVLLSETRLRIGEALGLRHEACGWGPGRCVSFPVGATSTPPE